VLYFVIADMANINDMYQNSLEYVKVLFNKAIDTTEKSENLETRLASLIDTITRQIYTNISRGLFERDKIIFSFLNCTSIMREKNLIDPIAWSLLLRGAAPITDAQKAKILPNPMPKNVLTDINHMFLYSAEINLPDIFGGILEDMLKENDDWLKWAQGESPQTDPLPGEWDAKLDDF
jgi:dynein heavy chain